MARRSSRRLFSTSIDHLGGRSFACRRIWIRPTKVGSSLAVLVGFSCGICNRAIRSSRCYQAKMASTGRPAPMLFTDGDGRFYRGWVRCSRQADADEAAFETGASRPRTDLRQLLEARFSKLTQARFEHTRRIIHDSP
jgi:hypothetical protein